MGMLHYFFLVNLATVIILGEGVDHLRIPSVQMKEEGSLMYNGLHFLPPRARFM